MKNADNRHELCGMGKFHASKAKNGFRSLGRLLSSRSGPSIRYAPPVLSLRVPEFFAKIFISTTFQEKLLDVKTKIGNHFLFSINSTIISFFHFLILVFLPFYVEQFQVLSCRQGRRKLFNKKTRPPEWSMTPFFFVLLLVANIASAQHDKEGTIFPTPGPSVNLDVVEAEVEAVTPDVTHVSNMLGTETDEELQHDQHLLDFLLRWEWRRLLNDSNNATTSPQGMPLSHIGTNTTPFIMCTEGGRAAVQSVLENSIFSAPFAHSLVSSSSPASLVGPPRERSFGLATAVSIPLFAKFNLTCFIVQSQPVEILKKVENNQIKYLAPLPATLKLARGLFKDVYQGQLFTTTASCAIGIRVVLSPGIDIDEAKVIDFVASAREDLRCGAYRDKLVTTFPFANYTLVREANEISRQTAMLRAAEAQNSKSVMSLETKSNTRLRHGGGREAPASRPSTNTYAARALRWWSKIKPVVNGSLACDWSSLNISVELPYLSVHGYCSVLPDPVERLVDATACLTSLVAYFASHPEVIFLETFPIVKPSDAIAAATVQSGEQTSTPLWDAGLDGSGQIIQVADTGVDMTSCFFSDPTGNVAPTRWDAGMYDLSRRKVVQLVVGEDAFDTPAGHGTHCAGTALGNSATPSRFNLNFRGVAYMAKLAFYDGGTANGGLKFPASMQMKMFAPGYHAGARVFSNSWGSNQPKYTYMDTEFDGFMYSQPDALIVVSAGNLGARGSGTVFSPSLSKNALCVGASQSLRRSSYRVENIPHFSGQGPTFDGRIKPDLVAPGAFLTSANSSSGDPRYACSVTSKSGTSMATAVVAGSVALLRQFFLEGRYPSGAPNPPDAFVPTGALLKALLINSAVPMERYIQPNGQSIALGLPPDNYQGFGRLQLDIFLPLKPQNPVILFVRDAVPLAEEETHTYKFTVPDTRTSTLKPFHVTLTWTDPTVPASAGAIVLHDLDLRLSRWLGSTVETYYPNGLTNTPDRINSVEKVVLYAPIPGDVYTVTVTGTSISTTQYQNYSLAVAGANVVMGAWYCQDPSPNRTDSEYRTEYCSIPCADTPFQTSPICCSSSAGATCTRGGKHSNDGSFCLDASPPPPACVPAATARPTQVPTCAPTRAPTPKATIAPSQHPTLIPPIPTTATNSDELQSGQSASMTGATPPTENDSYLEGNTIPLSPTRVPLAPGTDNVASDLSLTPTQSPSEAPSHVSSASPALPIDPSGTPCPPVAHSPTPCTSEGQNSDVNQWDVTDSNGETSSGTRRQMSANIGITWGTLCIIVSWLFLVF
jgi:hypothetical protein